MEDRILYTEELANEVLAPFCCGPVQLVYSFYFLFYQFFITHQCYLPFYPFQCFFLVVFFDSVLYFIIIEYLVAFFWEKLMQNSKLEQTFPPSFAINVVRSRTFSQIELLILNFAQISVFSKPSMTVGWFATNAGSNDSSRPRYSACQGWRNAFFRRLSFKRRKSA